LWVSSVNYASDVCIGDSIIKQCFDSYRKLRNTARYLLGSLHDYDPATHAVAYADLPSLDRYLLGVTDQFVADAKAEYDAYSFSRVFSLLQQFAVSDLSNFYLDIAKDRLCEHRPCSHPTPASATLAKLHPPSSYRAPPSWEYGHRRYSRPKCH
jgi:isoleucyl-tRNA synthetase